MADIPRPYPVEQPRYQKLGRLVRVMWDRTHTAFRDLREGWMGAAMQDRPDQGLIARVIGNFMDRMAGPDRSQKGFSEHPDGIVQQSVVIARAVGIGRGLDLVGAARPEAPPLTELVANRLREDSFLRLSEEGRLRFEGRLDEIRQSMIAGFQRGDSPDAIAKALSTDLTGYEAGRLRTIVRTEIAIASEAGLREELRARGIEQVVFEGDPPVPDECSDHIGNVYSIDDEENLPPLHPNCYCTVTPYNEGD